MSDPGDENERRDDFDFYPCMVDGAPASIYVNLRYEAAVIDSADTRYDVVLSMHDGGSYGIGTAAETAELDTIEEALIARARELGATYVGRLRTRREWTSTWYGPAGQAEALRGSVGAQGLRTVTVQHELDRAWRYYHELLVPDAERRRWMDDRRMVQILAEQGDVLCMPRRVDHRATFATEAARDGFLVTARAAGFEPGDAAPDAPANAAYLHRNDAIELDHIHDVVMTLVDAALLHGGRYEGWIAAITN